MIYFKPLNMQSEWDWFKERALALQCEDSQGVVAMRGSDILAVCVCDSFTGDSCQTHMAIDNPLVIRAGFLAEIARHLFITCDRSHIFGLVPSNNKRALKFNKHIGWREVTRIPDGVCSGTDYVVLRMDRDECSWLVQPVKEEAA